MRGQNKYENENKKKIEASCDAKINNQPTVTLVVTSVRPATVNHLPTVH